jgi:signal peptidase II
VTLRTRQHAAAALTVAAVVAIDVISKRIAEQALTPAHIPVSVVGETIRFTLAYNRGAAFGMHVGDLSRIVFTAIALLILGVLVTIYRESASPADGLKRLGLACVAGGAVGNLIDRVRFDGLVIDFLNLGIGPLRTGIFNVADMAIMAGALLLVLPSFTAQPSRGSAR